jgi:hypothetical protein
MDPVRNLALLRPEGLELASLPLASKPAASGDWAITIGNSYGGAPTQSVGNVAMRFAEPGTSLLQLSNEVQPGQQRRRGAQLARRTAGTGAGRTGSTRGPRAARARRAAPGAA